MSQNKPRKPRHSRNPSIPQISDYESDAPAMAPSHTYAAPPSGRTNTELNLSVLQRYLPSIHTILSIAANAVIYTFDPTDGSWDKAGIEGTMFVCAQSPLPTDSTRQPRACVFVLSRRSLENLVVDLARVSHVEIQDDLIILRVDGEAGQAEKVLGIWIHNDREEVRAVNATVITDSWKIARVEGRTEDKGKEIGPAMQAIGSGSLTLDDLFRSQRDANAAH